MISLSSIVNAVTRLAFFLLAFAFMGWALLPEYRPVFLGFIIGISAGLFNFRYLSIKVKQVSEIAVESQSKRINFGFLTRICITILAIMFAIRFDSVSIWATVAGLFLVQVLAVPVSIIESIRKKV